MTPAQRWINSVSNQTGIDINETSWYMLACKLLAILDSQQSSVDEIKRCLLRSSVIDDDDYIWLRKSDIDSLLSAIHTTAVYLKEYVKNHDLPKQLQYARTLPNATLVLHTQSPGAEEHAC